MLTAIDENGRMISLLANDFPKSTAFYCPGCQSALRFKKGKVMRAHFAHVSLKHCDYVSENESVEHLTLKSKLYASLKATETVAIESFLPDIRQVADLLVNNRLAIEVQCSQLSLERLAQRTQAYQNNGYQVNFLLGKKLWLQKRLSVLQKQFLYFSWKIGFHIWELDLEKNCLRLHYLIHEDLFGKASYLSKTCSLDGDILAFLRFPYQKQVLLSYQLVMDQYLLAKIQRALVSKNAKWLAKQEAAYLEGKNLLVQPLEAFYPQISPVTSHQGFTQIQDDLTAYYRLFEAYYQKETNKKVQTLFSPLYYGKMDRQ